jgi:hypothetical protein
MTAWLPTQLVEPLGESIIGTVRLKISICGNEGKTWRFALTFGILAGTLKHRPNIKPMQHFSTTASRCVQAGYVMVR